MGIRYFCDKCGNEFKSDSGMAIISQPLGRKFLCDECAKKYELVRPRLECAEDFFDMTDDDISLMEYDFKVGDIVITSTGETGIIESICDCDRCKARGFYEPRAKVINDEDTIYITDTDKSLGFVNFYQIGKYKFGNLDRESIVESVKYATKNVEEANKKLENYRKQLHNLSVLQILEKENKDFLFNIDENGYLNVFGLDVGL